MRNRPARAVVSAWRPGPDEQPGENSMYLECVDTLPQGTNIYEVETGYKDCKQPGRYQAYCFAGKLVCPGCQRSCRLPGLTKADPFIVRKRTGVLWRDAE